MVKSNLLRERRTHRFVMACVTGRDHFDPQSVRTHLSGEWKRDSFAAAEEVNAVTGYFKGSVAPLDLPEDVPIVFDNAFSRCVNVNINSGDPMADLKMDSGD